jgi:integrase
MACVRKRRGKYVLDFYDQYGKRHWETVGTIRKAADERLAQRVLEIKGNGFVSLKSRNVNFAEIAAQWLQSREGKIRPSTINQYENHLQNHLLPFFGPVKVWQIDLPRIDAYIRKKQTDMAELARRKTLIESVSDFERAVDAENLQVSQDENLAHDRMLSELRALRRQEFGIVTINKTLTTLGTILKYAKRLKLIEFNPVPEVERPRLDAQEYNHENEKMQILTPEQIRLFLAAADPGLYRILFTIAVMTGARVGELFALRWGDIDWVNNQILIRRSLSRAKGGWKFYEPKTKYSRRRIDVDPAVLLKLKKWKLMLPKTEPDDLIFPSPSGQPLHRSTVYKQGFLPAIRRSGVPGIRPHDLRHTFASLLIDQGEHPKYIQTQLGHSSINVTMDVYGHLMEKVNVKSANRLARTVFDGFAEGTNKSERNSEPCSVSI